MKKLIVIAAAAIILTIGLAVPLVYAMGTNTMMNRALNGYNSQNLGRMMSGTVWQTMMSGTNWQNHMNGTNWQNYMNGTTWQNHMNGTDWQNHMNGAITGDGSCH